MNIILALGIGFLAWALAGFFATRKSLAGPKIPPALRPLALTRGYALLMFLLALSIAAGCGGIVYSWTQRLQPLNSLMPLVLLISVCAFISGACLAILLKALPVR
ncbi:MAG: hypothetical protein ACAI44_08220 [Candidatus Sericytochromatia bacterium]